MNAPNREGKQPPERSMRVVATSANGDWVGIIRQDNTVLELIFVEAFSEPLDRSRLAQK